MRDEAAEMKKEGEELGVTRKTSEEAKRTRESRSGGTNKGEKADLEVGGRGPQLGESSLRTFQSDKWRDHQLLLELRAQPVRPAYAAPSQ